MKNRQPERLPIPTASEAAFERRLDEFRQAARTGAPPVEPVAARLQTQERARLEAEGTDMPAGETDPSAFLDELFSRRHEFLERDPFAGIGDRTEFVTKILGVSFEGRQDIVAGLRSGDELELVREPENAYDANAIAVRFGSLQVGFLRRQIAKHLAPVIDGGERYYAVVTDRTGGVDGRNYGTNVVVRRRRLPSKPRASASRATASSDALRVTLIGDRPLREAQAKVLERIAAGRNTLAVMGTGRGKSFCFQHPAAERALANGGKTVVLYPLRALGNEQFEALRRRLGPLGIRVFRANGSMPGDERADLMTALEDGAWDIICATPEFLHYHLQRFEGASAPSLVVVDEAHHVFAAKHRPAYARLGAALDALKRPQVIALTATCDDEAFKRITEVLRIDAWVIDATVRDNLHVVEARSTSNKFAYINDRLRDGKAIVYCNSRTEATKLAERLRAANAERVAFYHAGMGSPERAVVEDLFRRGEIHVVVATSAFGEGIDLPDVRNVFLYHLNFNFTEFNQQAGRAGRDGRFAEIHLLFGETDRRINDFLIARAAPSLATLRELWRGMRGLARDGELRLSDDDIQATLALDMADARTVAIALRIFEESRLVSVASDDDGRRITFHEVTERVDLTTNERFAEGEAERESFDEFCSLVLTADASLLERIINRPIYPQHVPLVR